jgi:osmotically inducible protein OsmC
MANEKRADVTWRGDLATGRGKIERVGSGAFDSLGVSWPARAPRRGRSDEPRGADRGGSRRLLLDGALESLADGGNPPESLSVSATVTFVPGMGSRDRRSTSPAPFPGSTRRPSRKPPSRRRRIAPSPRRSKATSSSPLRPGWGF